MSDCHSKKCLFIVEMHKAWNAICQWEDKSKKCKHSFVRALIQRNDLLKWVVLQLEISRCFSSYFNCCWCDCHKLWHGEHRVWFWKGSIRTSNKLKMIRRLLFRLLWYLNGNKKNRKKLIKAFDTCWWLFDFDKKKIKGFRIHNEQQMYQ